VEVIFCNSHPAYNSLDIKLARATARAWDIAVSGTLGVLVQAVKRELLMKETADELLQKMIARGYRSPYGSLQGLLENDQ